MITAWIVAAIIYTGPENRLQMEEVVVDKQPTGQVICLREDYLFGYGQWYFCVDQNKQVVLDKQFPRGMKNGA